MLKPGLGKGLQDLMHGDPVAGKKSAPESASGSGPSFGRGMETLIRPETAAESEVPSAKRPLLPVWFYFTADLLLLAYTIAITATTKPPFDVGTILFCGGSVLTGAILAIVGVIQSASRG